MEPSRSPDSARPLYPAEPEDDSLPALLAERGGRLPWMYLLVVGLVALALASLPWIRVPVTIRSPGVLRGAIERHEIRAPVGGLVIQFDLRENQRVRRGDLLAVVDPPTLDQRRRTLREKRDELLHGLEDLERLIGSAAVPDGTGRGVVRPRHRMELFHLRAALREQRIRTETARRELERARTLHGRGLVAAAEVERLASDHLREMAAEDRLVRSALVEWEARRDEHRAELRSLAAAEAELEAEWARGRVVAPVDGTLERVSGLSRGSHVEAGQPLAVLTPETGLVAEVHVDPGEVGLLRSNTPVRLRVHAFHSLEWGSLDARILEIPRVAEPLRDRSAFRVVLAPAADHLRLPTGAVGELRAGMTVEASFVVARRTLLQLLRENVSDWFRPAVPAAAP